MVNFMSERDERYVQFEKSNFLSEIWLSFLNINKNITKIFGYREALKWCLI